MSLLNLYKKEQGRLDKKRQEIRQKIDKRKDQGVDCFDLMEELKAVEVQIMNLNHAKPLILAIQ